MEKILITPRSLTKEGGHPSLEKLRQAGFEVIFSSPGIQPDESELLRLLPGCVGYLAGVEQISENVLKAAKGLRIISRNGVGNNNIDLEAAKRLNIEISITPGANSRGVAELTISLVFALARQIHFTDATLKAGKWDRKMGFEIKGKTLGIIGFGRIGKEVALMAMALGMKVIAFDLYPPGFFTYSDNFKMAPLHEVIKNADILSLHCPVPANKAALMDATAIMLMKQGTCLINTARGELLNDNDVIEALNSNKLSGVAVDVFVKEPPADRGLIDHPKVISTSHIGGFTVESVERAVDDAVVNILKTLQKQ